MGSGQPDRAYHGGAVAGGGTGEAGDRACGSDASGITGADDGAGGCAVYGAARLRAHVVAAFAALATMLAAVGIFSVLSFLVHQRAREFSVRLAVGASATDLLRLVLGGGLKLTAIGVRLASRRRGARAIVTTLLFGVPPFESVTFIVAPLILTAIAMLACVAPAILALRADPVAALRAE